MYLEHVFRALGLRAVDGEGVVCVVDGAPVGEGGFEGRFDFPVLDEVLHEVGEGAGFVLLLLCCLESDKKMIVRDGAELTLGEHLSCLGVVGRSAVSPFCVFVAEDCVGVGEVIWQSWCRCLGRLLDVCGSHCVSGKYEVGEVGVWQVKGTRTMMCSSM
jgi:hypothetical protein